MQIIEIKGKKWIVGLEWELLPNENSIRLESKAVAERTHSKFGILVDSDQQFAIGVSKSSSKVPSAALYLALANQEARNSTDDSEENDWIVVEDVGNDKFWLAVVKNGIPLPEYDAILDITEVSKKITNLLKHDTYKLFSTCPEIHGIFDGLKNIEEVDINTLTENVKTKIGFTKLKGVPDSVVYMMLALLVAMIAMYGVSTLIEGHNLKEKAESFERKRKEEEHQKQLKYENDLKNYQELRDTARKAAINNVLIGMTASPMNMLSAWHNTVGKIELGTHGWDLNTIECYFKDAKPNIPASSACDIKFIRNDLATNRMLLQEYPDALIKGNEAVVTKEVPLDKAGMVNLKEEDLNNLPNAKNWGFDMISQLQLLKVVDIEHEIKPSVDITFISPPKPVNPKDVAVGQKSEETNESIGIAKGQIIIKSTNVDLIKEVADNVDFSGVGARKVVFKINGLGDISWEATLDYFIRPDATGGISGSTSSGMENKIKEVNEQNNQQTK